MIESIAVLGMICIAMSAVYMLKNRETGMAQDSKDYIWVGHGKNPFKKF